MASNIQNDPEALLTRAETAEALTAIGFPIKFNTLTKMASRGDGPAYRVWGRLALYRWGEALSWAQERLASARGSVAGAHSAAAGEGDCMRAA
jgi:hypothetical protein